MSKIGKKIIEFDPAKIKLEISEGGEFGNKKIKITGPKGDLELSLRAGINLDLKEKELEVKRENEESQTKAYHGLYRSLISNMIEGVLNGYEKKLEIHGVGYRGAQVGEGIELNVGFSHKVKYNPPAGVKLTMPDQNIVIVSGVDKQMVGQVAAEIRAIRKPEPYKGKGIRYSGEYVRRKAGKSNAS